MSVYDYIDIMNDNGLYGGEIEIDIAKKIYKINIATYSKIYSKYNKTKLIGLQYINYYNHEDNNRNLLILTNLNNNHYNLAYVKKNIENIDNEFIIIDKDNINNNVKNDNKKNSENIKNKKFIKKLIDYNNLIDNKNVLFSKNNAKLNDSIKKYSFDDLSKKNFNDILLFYSSNNNKENYSDIYYYLTKKNDVKKKILIILIIFLIIITTKRKKILKGIFVRNVKNILLIMKKD